MLLTLLTKPNRQCKMKSWQLLILSIFFTNCKDNHQDLKDNTNSSIIEDEKTDSFKIIPDSTTVLKKDAQYLELEFILWGYTRTNHIPSDRKIKISRYTQL
ncbi:hypothetical protein OA93_00315 [Flavobacterium sp. KMS]|nr:hypothetical protein OA93_00315 [Flavobacterium sp. KMS]